MSPGNDRGWPREEPASKSNITDKAILDRESDESFDSLAAMRRRREAALRLPPLESGYRDPQFGFKRDGVA